MGLVYMLFAALGAAEWHRKAVGLPRDAAYLGDTNSTVIVSDAYVTRIDPEGEIVWRQLHANSAPEVQVGMFVYVLNDDGVLSAFNVSNGAKEWSHDRVHSFAVQPAAETSETWQAGQATDTVVVECNGEYAELRTFVAASGRWVSSTSEWTAIPGGYDPHLYACEFMPTISRGGEFYHLSNKTKACSRCIVGKPELLVSNNVVSLKDRWSLHEGLSNTVAACILTALHVADVTETWKQRASRHSGFQLWSDPAVKQVLVSATSSGSLYGLDAGSGTVLWVHHGIYEPGKTSIRARDDTLVVENSTHLLEYSMEGKLCKTLLPQPKQMQGYTFETDGGAVRGYANNSQTWIWENQGFEIVDVQHRGTLPSTMVASQITATDYLYKYLNPNLVAILARNSTTTQLVLLDGVSGRHLGSVMHQSPNSSLATCAIGENWVAYAIDYKIYFQTLYESSTPNVRHSKPIESSFSDTLVPYIVEQMHDLDQQVTSLSSIHTQQGTGSGLLVGLGHRLVFVSPSDFTAPTSPTSPAGSSDACLGITVSKHSVVHGTTIHASSTTKFEGSVAVAALGNDIFFTEIDLLGGIDRLPSNFSYNGVLLSVLILTCVAYQLSMSHMQAASLVPWS